MKKVTFVVIGDSSCFDGDDAIRIENREFNLGNLDMAEVNMAVKLRNIISEEMMIQELRVVPLSKFMSDWNSDETKVSTTFISYIHAIIEDKIKDENVNVAYGEHLVKAIQEEDYEKCAELITDGDGDIVGYNPRQDHLQELLNHLEGNTNFITIDKTTLTEIDKFL